jgi:2,4-dienoyl-CoA reductase-like NADH-dependent reductase (Old Yellow Enzyme family)
MSVKNRLVKSATYEAMAAANGSVTDQLIDMYTSLAKGGVGLIITSKYLNNLNLTLTDF